MSLQNLRDELKEYSKDTKINLGTILDVKGSPGLTLNQIWGIALSSAFATKSPHLAKKILLIAKDFLSEKEIEAAKAAASIMAMNNIYYRFLHMVEDEEFAKMPAKLRMMVIGNPGIEKLDFELYSLAISAIEGCGMCVNAHIEVVKKSGVSSEGIQSTIKIAAVINSTAQSLMIKSVEDELVA